MQLLELREMSLFPPALRDGQVGRAGLSMNGLGKGTCPGENHIFPKAGKSTREKTQRVRGVGSGR